MFTKRLCAVLLVTLIVLALLGIGAYAQSGYPISWESTGIDYTIGNGNGASEDVIVIFKSTKDLKNITPFVVPELRRFISVEPASFDTVQANTAYQLKLHFSMPAQVTPGSYYGTIHLRAGSRTYARPLPATVNVDFGDIVVPPTTKVLTGESGSCLQSVSPDGTELVFGCVTQQLASVQPGEIIVCGITQATPNGLLRRVLEVRAGPDQITLVTEPASLQDAIESGTISLSRTLTPGEVISTQQMRPLAQMAPAAGIDVDKFSWSIDEVLYDLDGNPSTTGDQIKAHGSLEAKIRFDFDVRIHWFSLEHVAFTESLQENAEIKLFTTLPAWEVEKEYTIAEHSFAPLTVWAGAVPIVFVPKIGLEVGVKGEAHASVESSITQDATLRAGLSYDSGTWTPIKEFTNNFGWTPPTLSAGCDFKGYAGPQLDLLLYGLAGPYAELHGYLQLQADISRSPWWELFAGVEAGVGVSCEALDIDYSVPDLLDYRVRLAHAPENPPGSVAGRVTNAVTGAALGGVSVQAYKAGSSVASAQTAANGTYSLSLPPGTGYVVTFSKAGFLPVSYSNIALQSSTVTHLETVMQIDEAHGGLGSISGQVLNALSGIGIQGLTVRLREGMNVRNGEVLASTTTAGNGAYTFASLNAGVYTAEASGNGFITSYFTVVCIGGQNTPGQNGTISPLLPSGEIRIVLTWGAAPSDLDSHLTGPLLDGARFHMFYPYAHGGSPWPSYVTLDVDDVSSYGPETTTIIQQIPGLYRFSVHDYSDRFSTNSTALSNSGAQVRVYGAAGVIAWFNVPANTGGTLWTVFELSGAQITPVNTMTYTSSPPEIQSFTASSQLEDEIDWSGLPTK